jgi:hypothetical protein
MTRLQYWLIGLALAAFLSFEPVPPEDQQDVTLGASELSWDLPADAKTLYCRHGSFAECFTLHDEGLRELAAWVACEAKKNQWAGYEFWCA